MPKQSLKQKLKKSIAKLENQIKHPTKHPETEASQEIKTSTENKANRKKRFKLPKINLGSKKKMLEPETASSSQILA